MSISHWKSEATRAAFEQAYGEALGLWPLPCASRHVETRFGATHVIVSGAEGGPPLVLVHAAGTTATLWHRQAAHLGAAHRLYALDILGDIGLSTQALPMRTRAEAAAWLLDLLDGLGLGQAALLGSSFGGFLSANLAVACPERVSALALLAPAATVQPFRVLADLGIRLGSLLPMPFTVAPALRGMLGGELPDERFVRMMEAGVRGFRYDKEGIYPSELPDEELASLRCPTLLLLGSEEVIYDPARAIERARRLIPFVEAEIYPGLGHLLGVQRADLIDGKILDFLREPVGGRSCVKASSSRERAPWLR